QGHNTYLSYEIKPTTSQFSFANSNASLACDPLGIYHLPLDTSRSSRLVLDLEVMAEHMYNVEFQVQRVSFFTQHVHYDYSDHAQEEPAQESGLAHQQDEISANPQPSEEALVTEDKWVLNVKPGGFERRTNVRVSISVGNRRGDVPDSVREPSSSSRKPPSGGSPNDEVPGKNPLPGGSFNDEEPGPSQRQEQKKKREDNPVAKEDTSLEPRWVELPLPGQELSAASPRMRASEFGDVIFVDHQEIQFRTAKYVVLLVLDGATNLLWATAQKTLLPEETISALRLWIEENNRVPKRVVGDTAFFTPDFEKFYKYHNIAQYPCGPRTPWPNRAETAVRLFKKTWALFVKSLGEEGMFEKITLSQAVKRIVFVRNCQLTVSGYSPLEVATGRRPPDLLDMETSNPEQLSLEGLPEDRTATQLRTIAMKAHLEARQSTDLKKDLAKRVMPSDGPYTKGEKVRRDHDEWHDVQIPHLEG
ncbi:GIP, partial [Symbiodinium pilosum]